MRKGLVFIILVTCITQTDVMNRVCNALCKRRYDGGYAKKTHCYCYLDEGLLEDFEEGQSKVLTENPRTQDLKEKEKPVEYPTRDW